MTGYRKLTALLAAAAFSITPAACGSDDEEGSADKPATGETAQSENEGSSGALSPEDYIKTVNEVQTEFASEAGKLDLGNPEGPADFKNSLDKLLVLLDTLVEDLEAAEPPEDVTAEHDALISSLRDYGKLVETNKEGLVSDNPNRVKSSATKIGEGSNEFSQSFDAIIKEINAALGK